MMYLKMTTLPRLALALLVLTLVACGNSDEGNANTADTNNAEPNMKTIRGTLDYHENFNLAPESVVTVELQDVSRQDVAAETVAVSEFLVPKERPMPFTLEYDANKIQPGHRYNLRAKVMEQVRLRFVSDQAYPVLEGDNQPAVAILLKHVPGGDVERMPETVRANNPTLSGHYRFHNKQGEFVDCADGIAHPLSREGGGIYALESQYRDVAPEYGDEVFVRLVGNYLTRPARSGQGKEDYLVVLQIEEMSALGTCP